jgi:hypothetical protein
VCGAGEALHEMAGVSQRHGAMKDMAVIASVALQHHGEVATTLATFTAALLRLQTAITGATAPPQQPAAVAPGPDRKAGHAQDAESGPPTAAKAEDGAGASAVEGGQGGSMQAACRLLDDSEPAVAGLRSLVTSVLQVRVLAARAWQHAAVCCGLRRSNM